MFGRNSNFPDLLDDDSLDNATLGQALELEGQVAKQAEMRVAAKRSLLHHDAQQKLKNALQRKPRGVDRTYLPGEKVYFWVVGVKPTRYRRDPGVWGGPAIIVAQESPQKYFISWRGRCLLVAATNLRPSTTDEAEDTDKTAAELQEMERVWMQKKEAEEVPRGAEEPEESKGPKWKGSSLWKIIPRIKEDDERIEEHEGGVKDSKGEEALCEEAERGWRSRQD